MYPMSAHVGMLAPLVVYLILMPRLLVSVAHTVHMPTVSANPFTDIFRSVLYNVSRCLSSSKHPVFITTSSDSIPGPQLPHSKRK